MNNGSLRMKSNNSRTTTTTTLVTDKSLRKSLIRNTNQDTSINLTDVSILSVGLKRNQNLNHEMLTDDDEDNEIVRITQTFSKTEQIN